MPLQQIRSQLGNYAKDTNLNLSTILNEDGASDLHINQIYAIALACSYTTKNKTLIEALEAETHDKILQEEKLAAKSASVIMAMNNIFYRFNHLVSDKNFMKLPVKLQMNVIAKPGIAKVDYELYCLAISAITGCGACIDAHVHILTTAGKSKTAIHSAIRIAAVINATAQALEIG